MQRRTVLASFAAIASAALAGCGGSGDGSAPTGPPTGPGTGDGNTGTVGDVGPVTAYPSLEAEDFDVYNESGNVTVSVLVTNPANRTRTMILNVSTRADGELATRKRELSLEPGANRTVNMTLPVAYDRWSGGLDFEFEIPE